MIVGIPDFKSALAVENILTPYKKGRLSDDKKTRLPKEKITPDVCMEILQSTNYARNIKDMLECIAELPVSEQGYFKEVVLTTFSNREQPEAILQLGRELAEKSGYAERLIKAQTLSEGRYYRSAPQPCKSYISLHGDVRERDFSDYDALICLNKLKLNAQGVTHFPPEIDASDTKLLIFDNCDLSGVQSFKMKDGVHASFKEASHLPHDLDLSLCAKVNLYGVDVGSLDGLKFRDGATVSLDDALNVPHDLDVSPCSSITLDWQELDRFDELKFRDGAKVYLRQCGDVPADLDCSMCSEVDFEEDNLGKVERLRFKDGAKVLFNHVRHFPKDMDVANCNILYFKSADLKELPQLDLKDGVELYLDNARTLSPLWDYSRAQVFSAASCDFWGFDELKFRKGAKVNLASACHLPKVLDVSECAELELGGCDLHRFDELTLGGKVTFHQTADTVTKMPKKLDLSHCVSVWVENNSADFSATQQIVFASREQQKRNNIPLPENWKGEVIFADEQPQQQKTEPNLGMIIARKQSRDL